MSIAEVGDVYVLKLTYPIDPIDRLRTGHAMIAS